MRDQRNGEDGCRRALEVRQNRWMGIEFPVVRYTEEATGFASPQVDRREWSGSFGVRASAS